MVMKMNEIKLSGSTSPEVSIGDICLCFSDECVHNEAIDIKFSVIAKLRFSDLPSLIKQIHELDGIGWSEKDGREWEVIIREKKAESTKHEAI